MGETGLAHQSNGNDASGDANVAPISLEFACGRLGISMDQLGSGMGPAKFARKWIKAELLNLLKLFLALLKLVAGLKLQTGNILSGVGAASIAANAGIEQGTMGVKLEIAAGSHPD
jgi:hypothetical protein